MAAADGGICEPVYNCYKVPGLSNPILETPNVSYLEDRYVLGKQLGWGRFGVIRSCTDMLTGATLACKSIAKNRLVSPDDIRGVKTEIEVMASLSGHPNVVDLKAVYEEEEFVHLVMELCAGGELFHRLEERGRFLENEAAVLFRHLMEVLVYCHDRGIVHRDLKPENILLVSKSVSSPIKLADFGLATYIRHGQSLTGTVGSPFYIAPEVLSGGYNEAADVWSAGVILYILLSGIPPFWGKTKSKIFESIRTAVLQFPSDPWERISGSAKDLISNMLKRDPNQRLTAKQVLDHSWVRGNLNQTREGCNMELDRFCSTPTASCTRDVSFGTGSSVLCKSQAAVLSSFSCRSSFSAFVGEDQPLASNGFSFSGMCEPSNSTDPTPIVSMPSFSFFGSSVFCDQGNILEFSAEETNVNSNVLGTGLRKVLVSPAATVHCIRDVGLAVSRVSKVSASRAVGTSSNNRRNHTISLGDLEQLDVIVAESITRWSSCTYLSSSLRSSLVC